MSIRAALLVDLVTERNALFVRQYEQYLDYVKSSAEDRKVFDRN